MRLPGILPVKEEEGIDVTIVIVSFNTREDVRECIESALDTTREASLKIVVVDNASADGTAEMLRGDFPDVHLIANNDAIHSIETLPGALVAPYWPVRYGREMGLWRPTTTAALYSPSMKRLRHALVLLGLSLGLSTTAQAQAKAMANDGHDEALGLLAEGIIDEAVGVLEAPLEERPADARAWGLNSSQNRLRDRTFAAGLWRCMAGPVEWFGCLFLLVGRETQRGHNTESGTDKPADHGGAQTRPISCGHQTDPPSTAIPG